MRFHSHSNQHELPERALLDHEFLWPLQPLSSSRLLRPFLRQLHGAAALLVGVAGHLVVVVAPLLRHLLGLLLRLAMRD